MFWPSRWRELACSGCGADLMLENARCRKKSSHSSEVRGAAQECSTFYQETYIVASKQPRVAAVPQLLRVDWPLLMTLAKRTWSFNRKYPIVEETRA